MTLAEFAKEIQQHSKSGNFANQVGDMAPQILSDLFGLNVVIVQTSAHRNILTLVPRTVKCPIPIFLAYQLAEVHYDAAKPTVHVDFENFTVPSPKKAAIPLKKCAIEELKENPDISNRPTLKLFCRCGVTSGEDGPKNGACTLNKKGKSRCKCKAAGVPCVPISQGGNCQCRGCLNPAEQGGNMQPKSLALHAGKLKRITAVKYLQSSDIQIQGI